MAIKSNNAIGKFFSNLVPNTEEVAGNIRGMHKRNFRQGRTNQKNIKRGLKDGLYETDEDLMKALGSYSSNETSVQRSKGLLNDVDVNDERLKTLGVKGSTLQAAHAQDIKRANNPDYDPQSLKGVLSDVKDNVKRYYGGDGVSDAAKRARIGTTLVGGTAGVAGLGVGSRFLSGGNLTQNGKGDRDIAGIPFV